MTFLFLLLLLAIFTAFVMLTGFLLLPWSKTRPFGLYAMMVEPGAVAALVLAGFLWEKLNALNVWRPQSDLGDWIVLGFMAGWFGSAATLGALCGFALATWIWWRFSPEPYRPLLISWYRKITTTQFPLRQRWGRSQSAASGNLES